MIINPNQGSTAVKKLDTIFTDTDNDGFKDKYVDIDTDFDGKVDERVDVDGDGKKESVALDTNLDRVVDSFLPTDLDKDGTEDYKFNDINGDGIFDVYSKKTSTVDNRIQLTENYTQETTDLLQKINDLTRSTNNIANVTALQKAQSAYIDTLLEAEATRKTMRMNNQATKDNALLDQQMMALRHNYNILAKQTEQYMLDAQTREQLTNLFFSLEKTLMDNSFSLAKQVVQSAKY